MMNVINLEKKRILKTNRSIYFPLYSTASQCLKMIMDCIFGMNKFRNEIVWSYKRWTNILKYVQGNHDMLLFYTNVATIIFQQFMVMIFQIIKLKVIIPMLSKVLDNL